MNTLLQDLRYALRQLGKSPGFVALVVGTLALGIAANSTIFSWINSTLFNPIPGVRKTSNMLTFQRGERSDHASPPFSYQDYVDLRDGSKTLTGLLAYHDDFIALTGNGKPQRIYGALTSANYFEVLGVKPILGRTLLASAANERAGSPEAVLGYDLWQSRFGGDPSIVGKSTQINLHTYTIVGVAPRGFQGCKSGLRTEIWIPLGMDRQMWGSSRIDYRGSSWLNVLGVMRPGVDRRKVENEFNLMMQRIAAAYPEPHQGNNLITADPLWRSPFGANVYLYGTLPILLALAAVLLLLACANVANLLLVRSVSRRREYAIRLSMGANRWRLVRQSMVENLLLALAGGAVALAITFWTARTLGSFLPETSVLPLNLNGSVDGTVTLVTILVAAFTSLVAGVIPALRASSLSPATVLKDEALNTSGGLHKSRLASGLVVVQVALSLTLLVCAGLFVRSLGKAQNADLGFDANHVYLATFDLDPLGCSNAKALELDRQILTRVKALPGVESATLADFSPQSFTIHSEGVLPEGYIPRPHESIEVDRGIVGPGYLQTLRTPLLAGRDFTDADTAESQPVILVNQAFVNRYWPNQDAIGKRIQLYDRWYSVAGVAANGKYRRVTYEPAPLVLFPLAQRYENLLTLHVRVTGDPMAYSSAIDQTIHNLSPDLPLFNVTTLKNNMRIGNVFERIVVVFAGSFGLLAMLLAAVGIYGVVAYTTRQRTHEIGIRMALGAARADVFRQVLRQGLRLTLIGLAAGIAVSLAFTRLLRGMLFGVGTADWITFATVAMILCVVASLACWLPARRAASIEPAEALRTD
jgi:predicted permease